jgi:hypothetical protein
MKSKKSLSFKSTKFENAYTGIDYEGVSELFDNGLEDRDIARDFNVSESYMKQLRKQTEEDY